MGRETRIHHDPTLPGLVLSLPDVITPHTVEDLRHRLPGYLPVCSDDAGSNILIDTNRHDFESIACIRAFRDVLDRSGIGQHCSRVAFVTPAKYRAAEVVSEREAYFSDVSAARAWLTDGASSVR
ncbi:MAG: hypothetical protein KUG77_29630 [Nannocystaceae bacterium]|nr:hypothetical protein [Nannocystaceae bacterium]